MYKVEVSSSACTICGTCVLTCPTDVLRMGPGNSRPIVAYPDDCQGCFVCQFDCPFDAIRLVYDEPSAVSASA
ncbi:MAG: 4Fe-4S dicluster domain-containing protein [Chloroflexota bacterium]